MKQASFNIILTYHGSISNPENLTGLTAVCSRPYSKVHAKLVFLKQWAEQPCLYSRHTQQHSRTLAGQQQLNEPAKFVHGNSHSWLQPILWSWHQVHKAVATYCRRVRRTVRCCKANCFHLHGSTTYTTRCWLFQVYTTAFVTAGCCNYEKELFQCLSDKTHAVSSSFFQWGGRTW